MKKRNVLAAILSLSLIASFAACGGASGSSSTAPADTPAPAETSGAAPASSGQAEEDIDWPKKSIEIIVSMSAGGDTDFNARCLAKYLTGELGQSVVVTNITGGGGSIGTEELINSPADGYRMYVAHAPLHTAQAFGVTDYGWDDMDPISIFGRGTGEFVTVAADFPADDIPGLIQVTKENPGKYKFGYNPGATSHYMAVALQMAGADFNMVSTGSAADRVVGLKGGHLDIILAAMPNIADYITTGEFKVLTNAASERHPNFPDIPTVKEQGVDASFDTLYCLYTVKGVDPKIIAKVDKAIDKIVNTNAAYQEEIQTAYSQVPYYQNTEETRATEAQQQENYMKIKDELRASFAG